MTPTLIVLGLLAIGVAIVAFATRHRGAGPGPSEGDADTGWSDPITPANAPSVDDPFAHAPKTEALVVESAPTSETRS